MCQEYWIWSEPLAFDCNAADFGAGDFIRRVGHRIDGISLLMSHMDFIVLYQGMGTEYELAPDYCSRNAHPRNRERERQRWTNFQLRGLVSELKKHDIKVFLSVFRAYHDNKYHHEFGTDHPGVSPIGFFDDGRDFQDFFAEKLVQTVTGYGFDGWHAADAQGPAGAINGGTPAVLQRDFEHFIAFSGIGDFPEQLRTVSDDDAPARARRSEYIWEHFRFEWIKYISSRWLSFHAAAAEALHRCGRDHMMNSCCAKSVFESGFYFGLDTRELAGIGVDYFVVESVATSSALISARPGMEFDIFAETAELAAALPGVKILALTGIQDVVESYNSILHAPARLERDIYCVMNQTMMTENGEKRCTDGVMYCLGDGIPAAEWDLVNTMYKQATDFTPVSTEGYCRLYDHDLFDRLFKDHDRHGTLSPYLWVSDMMRNNVQFSAICDSKQLELVKNLPLFVPCFDLLDEELLKKIYEREQLTVLVGNILDVKMPDNGSTVLACRISEKYQAGCIILNGKAEKCTEINTVQQPFDNAARFRFVSDRAPAMQLPDEFISTLAAVMKRQLFHPMPEKAFAVIQQTAQGRRRIAMCSDSSFYVIPDFRITQPVKKLHQVTPTPHDLTVTDDRLSFTGSRGVFNNIHIPPHGVFVLETE